MDVRGDHELYQSLDGMPPQKRQQLGHKMGSGFTKIGSGDMMSPLPTTQPGPIRLDTSMPPFRMTDDGFSCDTPTMAPMGSSTHHPPPRPPMASNMSSGLFNSPMFTVQAPMFEYSSAPSVFHNTMLPTPQAGAAYGNPNPMQARHSGMMSPIPFMNSPGTPMYGYDMQMPAVNMNSVPGLSLASPHHQNSVLERFKKFFDNQSPEEFTNDSDPTTPLHLNQPSKMPTATKAATPPLQLLVDDGDEISSAEISGDSQDMPGLIAQTESNAALMLRSGSSCHQCKSRRVLAALSLCSGMKAKRKTCRKKYCDSCLQKFYHMQPCRSESAQAQAVWCCPSCRGMCCCAACRRSRVQQTDATSQKGTTKVAEMYSPATSMAVGLVYFGDFDLLSGSVPQEPAMMNHRNIVARP